MKKVITFLFVLFMCITLSVPALADQNTKRLHDNADLLTESEEKSLTDRLDSVSEKYKVDVIIVTVETVGNYTSDMYINKFYDENNYGYGSGHDGVLLLVAMKERDYRILSNGLGAQAISPDDIEDIGDDISSYLTDGEYVEAFNTYIDDCEYQINGEINGFPFNFVKSILISLGIGLVVALIATTIMWSQLKSVARQLNATEYTKKGSMKVTTSNDIFLYRTLEKHEKDNDDDKSSSSSSSRNVGGGKF